MSDLDVKIVLKASDQGVAGVVREVRQESEQLKSSLDSTDKAAQSMSHSQDSLAKELNTTTQSAKKATTETDQYDRALKGSTRSSKKARSSYQKLTEGLNKAAQKTKKAAKATKSHSGSLAGGAISAGKWAAGIVAATVTATAFAVALNTQAIRETQVLAQTLDVGVQALTEWEYAAGRVNVSGEKVGDIFKDVSDKLGDFVTTGGGEAADLFENLNLKIEDLVGLSPDEQLLAIGGALDEVGNRGQKIFFLESLADDASRLLPLLENDADLLKELQLEAQVLGVSLTDIDAEKVALAGQAFDRVQGLAKGLTNDLTIELAPVLTGISDGLVDAAINSGGLRSAMKTVVDTGVSGLGFVLDLLQQFEIYLTYSEKGWKTLGYAATGAMASVADSTAKVINTVMYPFQKSLAWIYEKYGDILELGAELGGPFADTFSNAAAKIKDFSAEIDQYKVSGSDVIALHEAMGKSLLETDAVLAELLDEDAPSKLLKKRVEELRGELGDLAQTQIELRDSNSKTTKSIAAQSKEVKKQESAYAKLVTTLKDELAILGITGERERAIEINQRKLGATATKEQREEIARLTGQVYDFEQAAQKSKDAAQPWQDAWKNATDRIDSTFASAWEGAFDDFESFGDDLLDSFKKTLAEMAHLAITKPIVLSVTTAIGGALGIPGLDTAGGSNSPTSGFDFSSLTSLSGISNGISNIFSGTGISSSFTNFATSGIGQSLGLSSAQALPAGFVGPANVTLSGAGEFIGGGFSVGAGLGGFGAQLLGLGSGNAAGDAAAGAVGAMIGNAILPGIGGAIGSFLGTAVGGLFGDEDRPPNYAFDSAGRNAGVNRGSGENSLVEQSAFGELFFRATDAEADAGPIADAISPILKSIAGLESIIATSLDASQIADVTAATTGIFANSEDAQTSIDSFINQRLALITPALDSTFQKLAADAGKTGFDNLEYLSSITQLNAQLESGGPIAELFGSNLESAVQYLNDIAGENGNLNSAYAQLQQTQQFYYNNFFSEQERTQDVVDALTGTLDSFNNEFGASIAKKDDLRAFVDSLDLTTTAGQQAHQAAMLLAPQLVQLSNAMNIAGTSADTLTNSIDTEKAEQFYYNNFFSEQERAQDVVDELTEIINQFNSEFEVAISSKDDLRAFVDSLDRTSVAGQSAYQSALLLAPQLVELSGAMQIVNATTGNLSSNINTDWIDQRAQDIADNYQNELASINAIYTARQAQLQTELNAAKQLRQVVTSIRLSQVSPLSADQRVNETQAEFARLKALVDGGDITAADQLGSAAQNYLNELSNAHGADPYYVNEFDDITSYLDALGTSLGGSLDPIAELEKLEQDMLQEQRQLVRNSRSQLDLLAKQYAETIGIDDSLNALNALLDSLPSELRNALGDLGNSPDKPSVPNEPQVPQTPTNYEFVQSLYNVGLNREADTAGFSYWLQELINSGNRDELKATFFKAAEENGEENITYFATGGVVTRPQNFTYDSEISSNIGQRGEAGAEAIIPVGNGFIPAKFDNSLVSELRALREQNVQQALQLERLNTELSQLSSMTEKHGNIAQMQRDKQTKATQKSGRKAVMVST